MLREVREETGLTEDVLTQVAEFRELLSYELPKELRSLKTGRGQTQKWFLFDLDPAATIKLPENGEFQDFRWQEPAALAHETAGFRQPVYRRLVAWLADQRPLTTNS